MKKKDSYLVETKPPFSFKNFLNFMGPGVVAGAADDDPSGIGTYSIAGAKFGTAFLWTALLTWPLMASVQLACARIGMVTGQGLAAALVKKIPRPVVILICFSLFVANSLNVGADLLAMAECTEMLIGGSSHVYVIIFGVGIAWATVRLRYFHIARVMKWLAISLFSYIVAAFLIGPNWRESLHDTFVPSWPASREHWSMLVAILGTTISPYLFFWQSSQEVEEEKAAGKNTVAKRRGATFGEIQIRRYDVAVGTFFSNIVMYFIILATALTLHRHGLTNIETAKEAAEALRPIAGRFASLLYSIGLIGVGILAIPTLTGSAAYALAETFRWGQGLDAPLKKAKYFYAVIIFSSLLAIICDFSGMNPTKALFWSAIVNGILAPFLLLTVFLVIRDKVLMNGQPSSRLNQSFVMLTMLLMFGALIGMFVFG